MSKPLTADDLTRILGPMMADIQQQLRQLARRVEVAVPLSRYAHVAEALHAAIIPNDWSMPFLVDFHHHGLLEVTVLHALRRREIAAYYTFPTGDNGDGAIAIRHIPSALTDGVVPLQEPPYSEIQRGDPVVVCHPFGETAYGTVEEAPATSCLQLCLYSSIQLLHLNPPPTPPTPRFTTPPCR